MAPMSFISELMSSSSSNSATTASDAPMATRSTGSSRQIPLRHGASDVDNGGEPEKEKENAKLISIRELVAKNAAKDRPVIVVVDNNTGEGGRQQVLSEMLGRKMSGGSLSTASSDPTMPDGSSPQRNTQQTSAPSAARNALNELLLKRQPAQPATELASISPKASVRKKRVENPALQALLAQRSGQNAVSTAKVSSNSDSKSRAIADLLAKRVAPHPAPQATESSSGDVRKNALAEMLAKRGGESSSVKEKPKQANPVAEMLARRQGSSRAESTPVAGSEANADKENTDPKANALAEMLARRNGGGGEASTPAPIKKNNALADMLAKRVAPPAQPTEPAAKKSNALADMLAKRAAPPPPAKDSTASDPRGNALAEMLAKRGGGGEASASKPKANPLADMLAKRQGGAPPASAAANPLAEMMAKRQAAAGAAPTSSAEPRVESKAQPADEHADTPLKDHPKYATYFKMLKIGQPPEVVRHRMRREGVDPGILDFNPSQPLPKEPKASDTVADDQDPEFLAALKLYNAKMPKYQQMLKMGLPHGAVVQKMLMEGVDTAWLEGPPQPKQKAVPTGPTEAEIAAHREKYAQYFQMLKMGLPRGAVEQKMRMGGIDPRELDGPFVAGAKPTHSSAGASRGGLPPPAALVKKTNSIRKKLHWEVKRQESRDSQRESLWNLPLDEDSTLTQVKISKESKEILEKLFVKEATKAKPADGAAAGAKAGAGGKQAKKQVMYLIDMKKSQNIAITLARVKLSFPELKREILALNPTVLSTAQLQSLMDMWPDQQEQVTIDNFHGDDSLIGAAEKFLVEVRNIPRFKEKLGCLVFKQEFPTRVHELRESVNLVIRGVNQVCCSTALQQLFIYILQTGNLLNFGSDDTRSVSVGGFSLNSLVKLSQTKAFTGGVTFLQYVVQSIERDIPQLGRFPQQINLIQKCSKVSISSLFAEKRALEEGVKSLTHEAQAVVPAEGDADAELGALILKNFATEVECEVQALQNLLDQLMDCKSRFLEYFEEEETSEELDVLLKHIANFTTEFEREHAKHLAALEKQRLQEQQKKDQEAKKLLQKQKSQQSMAPRHSLHENPLRRGHDHAHRSNQHNHSLSRTSNASVKLRHTMGSRPEEIELLEGAKDQKDDASGELKDSRSGSSTRSGQSYFPQFVVDQLKKKASSGEVLSRQNSTDSNGGGASSSSQSLHSKTTAAV